MPQYDEDYITLRSRPGKAAEYDSQHAETETIIAADEASARAKATAKARARAWKIINVREHVAEAGSV